MLDGYFEWGYRKHLMSFHGSCACRNIQQESTAKYEVAMSGLAGIMNEFLIQNCEFFRKN